jgi:hypothetical protein
MWLMRWMIYILAQAPYLVKDQGRAVRGLGTLSGPHSEQALFRSHSWNMGAGTGFLCRWISASSILCMWPTQSWHASMYVCMSQMHRHIHVHTHNAHIPQESLAEGWPPPELDRNPPFPFVCAHQASVHIESLGNWLSGRALAHHAVKLCWTSSGELRSQRWVRGKAGEEHPGARAGNGGGGESASYTPKYNFGRREGFTFGDKIYIQQNP